ncbi:uncharacterized protein [Rutidosis leptorrhynchoides]|uniref:uncharacterized protein n=1 Tax=Rutidosis leptorrhynchoides TaxID=125765 RepID=UPI003A99462D
MAKWAIKLGEHDIEFRVENEEWKLYTDGASSSNGSGAGLMLVNPEGKEFTYALRFEFETTNNEAEYEALLVGLRMAKELKILHLRAFVDSQFVANQIMGTFEARQPTIQLYLTKAKELIKSFKSFNIEHVRRSQNKKADELSKLASLIFEHLAKEVLVEVLEKKSILEEEVNDLIQEDEVTTTSFVVYLETGILLEDKNKARKIRIKAPSYKMMNGALYRRSFLTPWLRCVGLKQATVIIQEMHEGICGLHAGPWSVVAKIMRLGYYWPTMHHDAAMFAEGYFPNFCERLKIQQNFTSVYPPQGNGRVEVTSRDIVKGIEKRLGKCRKGWIDELPLVLWGHRMTPKRSNGETPYSLAYGTQVVLPAEIQVLTDMMANHE